MMDDHFSKWTVDVGTASRSNVEKEPVLLMKFDGIISDSIRDYQNKKV